MAPAVLSAPKDSERLAAAHHSCAAQAGLETVDANGSASRGRRTRAVQRRRWPRQQRPHTRERERERKECSDRRRRARVATTRRGGSRDGRADPSLLPVAPVSPWAVIHHVRLYARHKIGVSWLCGCVVVYCVTVGGYRAAGCGLPSVLLPRLASSGDLHHCVHPVGHAQHGAQYRHDRERAVKAVLVVVAGVGVADRGRGSTPAASQACTAHP